MRISTLQAATISGARATKILVRGAFFFGCIQRKISLSGEKVFSFAKRSAIMYHIKLT